MSAPFRTKTEEIGLPLGGDADLDADNAALGVTGAGGGHVAAGKVSRLEGDCF